ncbi:MAG: hypothetical protein QM831_15130 [Kofleriaceae bacterium]
MAMESDSSDAPPPFDASVQLLAASYSTSTEVGTYQGAIPSLMYQVGRVSFGGAMGLYRINENGLDASGIGDVMAHVGVQIFHQGEFTVGGIAMVSAPTGDEKVGLGMGHPMAMPSIYGAWTHERVTVSASAGYSRALADVPQGHDHGVWPLVEPMNMSEVTWSAGAEVAMGRGVVGGVRMAGGHPFELMGHERVVGALRLGWGSGRIDTAAEVQTGFVGDPYTVRGLVETGLHF